MQLDGRGRIVVDHYYRTSCHQGSTRPVTWSIRRSPRTRCSRGVPRRRTPADWCSAWWSIRSPAAAVYGVPEVAGVGATEEEVSGRWHALTWSGAATWAATARGAIAGHGGLLKLIFRADDRKLLGVHCFGDIASEVVNLGHVVLHVGASVELFLTLALNTPTYSYAYHDATVDGLTRLTELMGLADGGSPTAARSGVGRVGSGMAARRHRSACRLERPSRASPGRVQLRPGFRPDLAQRSRVSTPGARRILMADHFSGPRALADPASDITDVYAFPSPERPGHLVLVLDVFPAAAPTALFSDALTYRFRLRPVTATTAGGTPTFVGRRRRVRVRRHLRRSGPGRRRCIVQAGTCTTPGGAEISFRVGDETADRGTGCGSSPGARLGSVLHRPEGRAGHREAGAAGVPARGRQLPGRRERA